ncbi:peroxiredoxin [Sphingomonas mucosissima]|uniref:thioredoxin-dependent peroxiredoxin n=1 Tax=Sphingomonas mucosissima TaxID=370959 RepID=A0A245ZEU4_9SPHN|nr:peroxiredoxin [Sphingomonas mucosissima]OWK28261.1 putative peroxiredoxin bcp [Sphingomonas mucosissima]
MDMLPDVKVTAPDGTAVRLRDQALPLVVYFYPKDDTKGCTREAQDFSALADEFTNAGVSVLGISRDTPAKHQKFIAKYDLAVALASDEDGSACEAFGTWVEKSMYGRTYMGIERATFLFDREGRVAREWRKVKVAGHADAVLEAARAL